MGEKAQIAELILPVRREAIGAVVMTLFIGVFVCLAGFNLFTGTAIVVSSVWLVLIVFVFAGFCKEKGTKRFLTDLLGAFASKQFIRTLRYQDKLDEVQFGYQMFGHLFF